MTADFTSALYLGMHHPSRSLRGWDRLTTGVPAALGEPPRAARLASRAAGSPNPVTGKPASGDGYAPSTVAHSETVLRRFYDFCRDCGTGPVLNPFPLDASRRRGRPHAHHNPMDTFRNERSGLYRPKVPKRNPRNIPDDLYNALFARLGSAPAPVENLLKVLGYKS